MPAIDQYTVSTDPTFQHRVQMLVLKAAAAVQSENPAAANHSRRSALAHNVFYDPAGYAARFAAAVAADPNSANVGLGSTDDDLLFTINSLWDALSLP
jgi:hypothetical protein